MPGVMVLCAARLSACSARPVLTAEPRRSMLSEEGGVGTTSSRVRRTRSSRGLLARTAGPDVETRRDLAPFRGADAAVRVIVFRRRDFAPALAFRATRFAVRLAVLWRLPERWADVRVLVVPARLL